MWDPLSYLSLCSIDYSSKPEDSILFHNAQATTFSFLISSISASALLIIILKSLIEEQNRLFYIWQYRENSYGLWLCRKIIRLYRGHQALGVQGLDP